MPTPPTKTQAIAEFKLGLVSVFDAILSLDKASFINRRQRKDGGVVYTPRDIAGRMCELANPQLNDRVFEPSCGRGVFIFSLAEHHLRAFPALEVHDAMSRNLWACDIDGEAIDDLRSLWRLYWMSKGVANPADPHLSNEDSLFGAFSHLAFDLTLGNPPYVRFQNLPETYRAKLQAAFSSCAKGNVDIYFAFVEKALTQSRRACLIIPNGWMSSSSGKALRSLLTARTLRLADYGSRLPFAPVRAYVCVALAQDEARPPGAAIMVQLDGLEPGKPWLTIAQGDPRLSPARWSLSEAAPKPKLASFGRVRSLGDIATLHSGIATLADSSYAILGGVSDGERVSFLDPLTGQTLSVALSMAPKKIKLTKAKSESDMVGWSERILHPYAPDGSLIPFSDLEKEHPDAAQFLLARKKRLSERDKGKQDGYPEWHAYGRRQGLNPLPKGKLCALPTMSEGSLLAFDFDMAATGEFLFTSGFVLAPKPGHETSDILAALLDEASWAWILAHGKAWAGPDHKSYRSYGSRLLLSLPLP